MDRARLHELILSLPEVTEYEHGGLPAFRVRGKRFASMLDERAINLMPGEEAILAAAASWPGACEARTFAGRVAAVGVRYGELEAGVVEELVADAWASKAPRALVRARLAARDLPS
jgi:hypothetical protein